MDPVVSLGQEVLRGKEHLSHRCFALAAWKDLHLRRRQPCCEANKPSPIGANMQLCRGVIPGQSNSFIMLFKQILKSQGVRVLDFGCEVSGVRKKQNQG